MVEFADSLFWTYVMGGLARDYTQDAGRIHQELLVEWLDAADDAKGTLRVRAFLHPHAARGLGIGTVGLR